MRKILALALLLAAGQAEAVIQRELTGKIILPTGQGITTGSLTVQAYGTVPSSPVDGILAWANQSYPIVSGVLDCSTQIPTTCYVTAPANYTFTIWQGSGSSARRVLTWRAGVSDASAAALTVQDLYLAADTSTAVSIAAIYEGDDVELLGSGETVAGLLLISDGSGGIDWGGSASADISSVVAGAGLTGGGLSGDVTLNVAAGDASIVVAADAITAALGTDIASAEIVDGTIVNADVNAAAGIAWTKVDKTGAVAADVGAAAATHAAQHATGGGDAVALTAAQITSGQLGLARGGTNADLSAEGCAGCVLQQAGVGAAITSATLAISSTTGTVPLNRGGTGADLSATGGALSVVKQAGVGANFSVGELTGEHITTGTVADARLTGNVSLLGQTIESAEITNATIVDADIAGAAAITWTKIANTHAAQHGSAGADPVSLNASQISAGQLALARGGTNADLSATGGATHVLRQAAPGAAITVGALTAADVGAASTTHAATHLLGSTDVVSIDGSQVTQGTVAVARIHADMATDAEVAVKTDKVIPGDVGNLAGLDATGNLTDSHIVPASLSVVGHTHAATDVVSATLADARLSANVSLIGQTIETAEVTDGTLVNDDINAAAAIAWTKISKVGAVAADVGAAATAHVHSGADVTSGTVLSARIDAAQATDAEVTAEIASHAAAVDPHTVYVLESTANAALGYLRLDAGAQAPLAQIPTTLTGKDADTLDTFHAADFVLAGAGAIDETMWHNGSEWTSSLMWYLTDDAVNDFATLYTAGTGYFHLANNTATSGSANPAVLLDANVTGAPAIGTGSAVRFRAESSTTDNQLQSEVKSDWEVVNHAARQGRLTLGTYDFGGVLIPNVIMGTDGASAAVTTVHGLTTDDAITSTLAAGTAPFTVASNTVVTNLNADLLDGIEAATFSAGLVTNGNTHDHAGGDGNQIDHGGLGGLADDDHTQYMKEEASGGLASEVPDHTHQDAANAGTLDHGLALTGLADDDHTQYGLVDGTRAFTGQVEAPAYAITLTADATIQPGELVMPDAGTDERFDANTTTTFPIGVLVNDGQVTAGTSATIAMLGIAYVAPDEDDAVTRGDVICQGATAGYASSAAAPAAARCIGRALTSEAVYTICSTGACVNEATETITLSGATGWAVNTPVTYWNSGGTTITGLTDGATYYIKTIAGLDVTLSLTVGGAAVDLQDDGDDSTQYLIRHPKVALTGAQMTNP